MSHDTHEHHHHDAHNDKPVIPFKAGIYFVLILAGLFLASISFVKVMSHDEGGHDAHGGGNHTEAPAHHEGTGAHEAAAPHEEGHEAAPAHGEAPAATHETAPEAHH